MKQKQTEQDRELLILHYAAKDNLDGEWWTDFIDNTLHDFSTINRLVQEYKIMEVENGCYILFEMIDEPEPC